MAATRAPRHELARGAIADRPPRYHWRGGPLSRTQWVAGLTTLAVGIGLGAAYLGDLYGSDVSPDSRFGYVCAIAGTLLLLAAGAGYALRKRLWRHGGGRLHVLLAWHSAASVVGLLLILMHATGSFNARSGTYALAALVALVVSGVIGRGLDRLAPWLAARSALRMLTADGEEWLGALEREAVVAHPPAAPPLPPPARQPTPGQPRVGPWDIAYFDLDPEVETIAGMVGAVVRGHGTPAAHASARQPGQQEVRQQAARLRAALRRETFYIQLVRVWRRLHLLLSLVFVGLLAWHIIFAVTLLLR